jgi:hypothetical protein
MHLRIIIFKSNSTDCLYVLIPLNTGTPHSFWTNLNCQPLSLKNAPSHGRLFTEIQIYAPQNFSFLPFKNRRHSLHSSRTRSFIWRVMRDGSYNILGHSLESSTAIKHALRHLFCLSFHPSRDLLFLDSRNVWREGLSLEDGGLVRALGTSHFTT